MSNLLNYATKFDLKEATGINTLKFAKDVDLNNFKSDICRSGIDKLKTVSVDLIKLNNVIKK